MTNKIKFLDCTLRDGGYYNAWNFSHSLVQNYIDSVSKVGVDIIEIGFRSTINNGFKGGCAYSTDEFINSYNIPDGLIIAVMINASEVIRDGKLSKEKLKQLFPNKAEHSPVKIVRIASHYHEINETFAATEYLHSLGYSIGVNLMQIGDRTTEELQSMAKNLGNYPIDVFYFADSLGNLGPDQMNSIIEAIQSKWGGEIGIHAHDNMSLALSNTVSAIKKGVTWVDSTITGMGRGAGNTKTELLALEIATIRKEVHNISSLMSLIENEFIPLKNKHRWGSSPYYYLSGMYGIHPTYVQQMIADNRYADEDIIAALEHLKEVGAKKYSEDELGVARNFYKGRANGTWSPISLFANRDVLLIGPGSSVKEHKVGLESYIRREKPLVLALNTKSGIDPSLINLRICSHPIRVLADFLEFTKLGNPLITPVSMLPKELTNKMTSIELLDYGLGINKDIFEFHEFHSIVPSPLVIAYALAIVTSGKATGLFMAGFDGYQADDSRRIEVEKILELYKASQSALDLIAITPSLYNLTSTSVYAL